jgi:hypothetical protein
MGGVDVGRGKASVAVGRGLVGTGESVAVGIGVAVAGSGVAGAAGMGVPVSSTLDKGVALINGMVGVADVG